MFLIQNSTEGDCDNEQLLAAVPSVAKLRLERDPRSLWRPKLVLGLLICQPSTYTRRLQCVSRCFRNRFSSLCARAPHCIFKKKDCSWWGLCLHISRCRFVLKAVCVFSLHPARFGFNYLRNRFGNKGSINASSNYSIDVLVGVR